MKEYRIGIFGAFRGQAYMAVLEKMEGIYVAAVCDKDTTRFDQCRGMCRKGTLYYTDFDEMLTADLDAVILCNYFHEHVPYAIKAMEHGIHVLSETMAASTLAEAVALCRAVERTGCKYMLAENYPFMLCCHEMKKVFDRGDLGAPLYSEGEYIHVMPASMQAQFRPFPHHWRNTLPRVYYNSHALAPLCYITGAMPVSVTAMVASSTTSPEGVPEQEDRVGIMLCRMSDGSISRTTGCGGFAPDGNWWRIGCVKGGVESVRGNEQMVRVTYHPFSTPEGIPTDSTYEASWHEDEEKVANATHGGGDYWVIEHFKRYLLDEETPFFDVYRSCTLAAVGIYAWKSIVAGDGMTQTLPDFKDEEQRRLIEKDDFSPFFYSDGREPTAPDRVCGNF